MRPEGGLCYNLICSEEYDLAIILLEFATEVLKQHADEEMRLMLTVNLCQAYKWSGNQEKCIKMIKKMIGVHVAIALS